MSLDIGSLGWNIAHDDIHDIDFYGGESISTFDVILVEPRVVSMLWETSFDPLASGDYEIKIKRSHPKETWKTLHYLKDEMNRRKEEFAEFFLNRGGYVVTKLVETSKIELTKRGDVETSFNGYSFLRPWNYPPMGNWQYFPSEIESNLKDRKMREGESINITREHPFSEYLNFLDFSNGHAQLDYKQGIEPFNEDWMEFIEVIAENEVGKILAAEFPIQEGGVVFVPEFELNNSQVENDVLVSSLQGLLSSVSPINKPEWTSRFNVPGENCNQSEIHNLEQKIEELQSRKKQLIHEQEQYKDYKKLLYGTGKFVLEPVVRDAFELLGFNVTDESPEEVLEHEIDGLLDHSDFDESVIVEISGKSNDAIKAPKFYQLETRVTTCSIELDGEFTGLLVGNGYSDKEPEERESQFSDEVIKLCKHRDFVCLSTYQIYSLVEIILEEEETSDLKREVRVRIVSGSGQIDFSDLIQEGEDT